MNGQGRDTFNQNLNKNNIKESTDELLHEGKKFVGDLYEDGKKKMEEVQKEAQGYTEELLEKVRENPIEAVLIAGGIGFLLSALLKK